MKLNDDMGLVAWLTLSWCVAVSFKVKLNMFTNLSENDSALYIFVVMPNTLLYNYGTFCSKLCLGCVTFVFNYFYNSNICSC